MPSLNEVYEVLSFSAGFNSNLVLFSTTCLGVAAGVVGTFALLRKKALLGDALAHSTLPGICLMFCALSFFGLDNRNLPMLLLGAALSGVAGVLCVHAIEKYSRLTSDVAIGVVLSVFFGFGVVMLSIIQSLSVGGEAGIHSFIFGQTAAMRVSDAKVLASSALIAIALSWLLLKEFRLVCFDSQFASVQGWPVSFIDLLLMTLIVGITVIGLQAVGLLLIVAMLITPAVSARFWTERVKTMCWISALIGGLSGYFGSALSSLFPRFPAGALIVLTATLFFLISFLIAPERGVLASFFRIISLRIRVLKDHVLRHLYEINELSADSSVAYSELDFLGSLPKRPFMKFLAFKGLLEIKKGQIMLTELGHSYAFELVRRHRLWEQYIYSYGDLAVSHVDYSADLVEHVLSPSMVLELESALREKGDYPENLGSLPPLSGQEGAEA